MGQERQAVELKGRVREPLTISKGEAKRKVDPEPPLIALTDFGSPAPGRAYKEDSN